MALRVHRGRGLAGLAAVFLAAQAWIGVCAFAGGKSVDGVEVFVPRVVIYPGSSLLESLLDRKVIRNSGAVGAPIFTTSDSVAGLVARRTLVPGQPIPKSAVGSPAVVQQGQPVTVHYLDGPISITLNGVAMQAGGTGDTIPVRNADSGRILRATVRSDGSLRMNAQ